MKFVKTFENFSFKKMSDIISDIRDISYELDDQGIYWGIQLGRGDIIDTSGSMSSNDNFRDSNPHLRINDIDKKILSMYLSDLLDDNKGVVFKLEIEVTKELTDRDNRTGMFKMPDWFKEYLYRLEDYIEGIGLVCEFKVRLFRDLIPKDSIEDLSKFKGLALGIIIEFDKKK